MLRAVATRSVRPCARPARPAPLVRASSAAGPMRRAYSTEAPTTVVRPASAHVIKGAHRPTSPHVSIYKFPLPAMASITTRVTGVALTVGVAAVASLSVADPLGGFHAVEALKAGAPALVPVAKAAVAFPVVYHYLAGLRHLYWDRSAAGFSLEEMQRSSTLLIALAVLLTLALTFVQI